jgi:hypothetical protein
MITVNTQLLSVNADAKTRKGSNSGYLTGILYLAPANEASSKINVCPYASEGCKAVCLYTAGRGKMDSVVKARVAKTLRFLENPKEFVELLAIDIQKIINKASKVDMTPAIRLNGTSDLPWEKLGGKLGVALMNRFPSVAFYDYTKNPNRAIAYAEGKMPDNYHLTFSKSECNDSDVDKVINAGGNVATVFSTKKADELPESYKGRDVVDGDKTDLRFLDKDGVFVGLRAKGDARSDSSGFTVIIK